MKVFMYDGKLYHDGSIIKKDGVWYVVKYYNGNWNLRPIHKEVINSER